MKFIVLVSLLVISVTAKEWWEGANFYQIYPRSFMDSNGDGVGDLNGVAQKLQYLKDIGIDGAWLSPIFASPMADFGYDISNYYDIHWEFGTLQDFRNLIAKAKEVGIKIILDFVPNHTSDENEWFIKSVQNDTKYGEYYVWKDPIYNESGRFPPNNWVSVFRRSAWEWNEDRQQYYLHAFVVKQPDLNYRNPDVVAEMKNVLKFWLDEGVAGFRIDAVPYMFEEASFADEPPLANPKECPDPDDYCHLQHIYTQDQPETYDMIFQWRQLLDDYQKQNGTDSFVILTEAYTSLPNIIRFYGENGRNGSHVPFNFQLISFTNISSTARDFDTQIDSFLSRVPKNQYANWVLGNHDNKRLASRYGPSRADLLNMLLQTLPGIAVTYNGEELAMVDLYIPWEDTVDPAACNSDPEQFNKYSRDPARTPFHWDASKNAGFSTASKTWLPVSPTYTELNVQNELKRSISNLQVFRKLLILRREPSFTEGTYEKRLLNDDVLIYKREKSGSDIYIVILNFGKTSVNVNLKQYFPSLSDRVEVITTSIQSTYTDGDIVDSTNFNAEAEVGTVVASIS